MKLFHLGGVVQSSIATLTRYLPRGNLLDDAEWSRRHRFLQLVLLLHLPFLYALGLWLHHSALYTAGVVAVPAILLLVGHELARRRPASIAITAGLTACSAALVILSRGSIEAHFHFFIIIGFIALYQDWVPFLWNVVFVGLSHGLGSLWISNLIFDYAAAQRAPWLWSAIHASAVLVACVGMVVFWRVNEDEQREREALTRSLAHAEADRRRFTSELLVNLARRNQSMLYRQLEIINQLENEENDPDALANLFRLDHLATRVRRNAESLLVLSGDQPARVWSAPVALHDVVRAATAEIESMDRVDVAVDESVAVIGHSVSDLSHLLAELIENAVRFSPPRASVTIRSRPQLGQAGAHLITIEDWGIGMSRELLQTNNQLLADPPEVDLDVPKQLGFHVVGRLARRHGVTVTMTATPGGGLTAAVSLPAELFVRDHSPSAPPLWQYHATSFGGRHPRPTASGRHASMDPPPFTVVEAEPVRWQQGIPKQPPAPAIEGALGRTRQSVSAPGRATGGQWDGWWSSTDEPDRQPEPTAGNGGPDAAHSGDRNGADHPQPVTGPEVARAEPDPGPVPGDSRPRLRRRVPQSHLVAELKVPGEPAPAPMPRRPAEQTSTAAHALSRYQASRNAARERPAESPGIAGYRVRADSGVVSEPIGDSR